MYIANLLAVILQLLALQCTLNSILSQIQERDRFLDLLSKVQVRTCTCTYVHTHTLYWLCVSYMYVGLGLCKVQVHVHVRTVYTYVIIIMFASRLSYVKCRPVYLRTHDVLMYMYRTWHCTLDFFTYMYVSYVRRIMQNTCTFKCICIHVCTCTLYTYACIFCHDYTNQLMYVHVHVTQHSEKIAVTVRVMLKFNRHGDGGFSYIQALYYKHEFCSYTREVDCLYKLVLQ